MPFEELKHRHAVVCSEDHVRGLLDDAFELEFERFARTYLLTLGARRQ